MNPNAIPGSITTLTPAEGCLTDKEIFELIKIIESTRGSGGYVIYLEFLKRALNLRMIVS